MNLRTRAVGAALLVLEGVAVSANLSGAPAKDLTAEKLERLVPRIMKEGDVPGLSLAVVQDGRIRYHRAFGVREAGASAAVDDDTIFEAASLSKPVFAYAVLKLVDAGVLDLDTPVAKLLPGDYAEDPRARRITPRHVLTHTTGFPNWRSGPGLKMFFEPGERFSYSGEGFVYLQKAVERATGQTLESLMTRLVFEPLGMRSSSYVWQDRFEGRTATGHDGVSKPIPLRRPWEAIAAASLHTTAIDYAHFLIAALDGAGLAEKTRAEMLRMQIRVDEGCDNCIARKPTGRLSREIGWGLGWGLEESDGGVALWHWGDNGSGFHCYVLGDPRRRSGVVVLTNSLGGHGIIPDVVTAAVGRRHPAFAWLDYERYDSPARTWFKDILARGSPAIEADRDRRAEKPGPALTETQVNRVGYWLLSKKKIKEAVAVFQRNAADFPQSWNAYDSLGEAYAADEQRERAIASYEKSITLNPENVNGVEMLRKLKAETPPRAP